MTAGDLQTGARIGRYVVIESVGSGAMGVVYGAYDPELDRKIALKLLKPGQGAKDNAKARLLREAQAMARLAHPNVVAVHDVGVFEDQVFLAMEFLGAGTIKSWLAGKPRHWREILAVFTAAGRGLMAAHAAGIVHRDFKPDNVLLDKEGRPRVVDFGIARQAEGGADDDRDGDDPRGDLARTLRETSGNAAALLTLTKTGAMVGTPAYMAPEQFMGERGDERSDQFSFCVALYEALYGERPFAGSDILSISVNVTTGELRPLPKDRGVPAWIRRVILRGVKADPAVRWPSMAALVAALEDDPAVKLRRRVIAGAVLAAVAASFVVARQMVTRRRADMEREIARHEDQGRVAASGARGKLAAAEDLRRQAFAAFDGQDRNRGELLWRQTTTMLPGIDADFDRAEQSFQTAYMLDTNRDGGRTQLAAVRREHFLFAEDFRLGAKTEVLEERVAALDTTGEIRKGLSAPVTVTLNISPAAVHVRLERYEREPATGRRIAKTFEPGSGPVTSTSTMALPPGSYRLTLAADGQAEVVYPFDTRRGERVVVDVTMPKPSAVPEGFVYVAAGSFWYGDADEQLRIQFLDTSPIHRRQTADYLVARHETTYRDWIVFLDAQSPAERERHLPEVSTAARGWIRLRRADGAWQLAFQPATIRYAARVGEPVTYVGRKVLARQDWTLFPVTGISFVDVKAYLAWLDATGRVPGARLCNELEWERAARGGDDRVFPHGDELHESDANFDVTYGRIDSAFGPDAVGSHPASRSPFGLDDLAGNVLELALSSEKADEIVIRGGGYYFGAASARSTNRLSVPATFRDFATGFRVCASLQGER